MKIQAGIYSEIDDLKAVLIHPPGPEVEMMTPTTAERALYSDILNKEVASTEYDDLQSVLESYCKVYEIKTLLKAALEDASIKQSLISELEQQSNADGMAEYLSSLDNETLIHDLIEGVPLFSLTLNNFMNKERFALPPLHNFFFTRDASFCIGNKVHISSMAKQVRKVESILLNAIHSNLVGEENVVAHNNLEQSADLSIEGGDVLVISKNTLVIGVGLRTTAKAVDNLISETVKYMPLKNVLVQELPQKPESFIHLDMTFTLLDIDKCMVYKPLILDHNKYQTVQIEIEGKKISKVNYVENLLSGLKKCGYSFKPVLCGDGDELWQEREQWHSAGNFFALSPGKVIGYQRNVHTLDAMSRAGFNILSAQECTEKKINLREEGPTVVAIKGSELSRGGGGARCMTMPLIRS